METRNSITTPASVNALTLELNAQRHSVSTPIPASVSVQLNRNVHHISTLTTKHAAVIAERLCHAPNSNSSTPLPVNASAHGLRSVNHQNISATTLANVNVLTRQRNVLGNRYTTTIPAVADVQVPKSAQRITTLIPMDVDAHVISNAPTLTS